MNLNASLFVCLFLVTESIQWDLTWPILWINLCAVRPSFALAYWTKSKTPGRSNRYQDAGYQLYPLIQAFCFKLFVHLHEKRAFNTSCIVLQNDPQECHLLHSETISDDGDKMVITIYTEHEKIKVKRNTVANKMRNYCFRNSLIWWEPENKHLNSR